MHESEFVLRFEASILHDRGEATSDLAPLSNELFFPLLDRRCTLISKSVAKELKCSLSSSGCHCFMLLRVIVNPQEPANWVIESSSVKTNSVAIFST